MSRRSWIALVACCLPLLGCGNGKDSTDGGQQPVTDGGQRLVDGGLACGDGVLQAGEGCDDGNRDGGDGCSAACQVESGFDCKQAGEPCTPKQGCGDRVLQGAEQCDDGNLVAHDGCSATCTVEPGYLCPHAGHVCHTQCGDHLTAGAEQCDDGNTTGGDGCSALCQLEEGWQCPSDGGMCGHTVCGNHVREGAEQCDDGNHDTGDGCSPLCQLEPRCDGGSCAPLCGDGVLAAGEACDDGNLRNGDGCSATCQVELDSSCAPSINWPSAGVDLAVVYRDMCGWDTTFPDGGPTACAHPDFGHFSGYQATTGLVQSRLGTDGKPQCKTPVNTQMLTDCTLFNNTWYHDVPTTNRASQLVANLARVTALHVPVDVSGFYTYDNQLFFPWDGLGWVAMGKESTHQGEDGQQHNFSFTTETRFWFTYQATEQLNFTGDDDVWIFVNRNLAIDLGGLHPATPGMLNLNAKAAALGLVDGGTYEAAVFQAERHWNGSHYTLELERFGLRHSVCKSLCGDHVLQADAGEECDDGNTVSGDGCSSTCLVESP